MCGDNDEHAPRAAVPLDDPNASEDFPWKSGRIFDAHCHPTDTMASLSSIPAMGTTNLTVMSTRGQDQDLVAQLGAEEAKVVPAFGWHPWFSYRLYDDTAGGDNNKGDLTSMDDKRRHLASVLTPSPPLDNKDDNDKSEKTTTLLAALDALASSLPAIRPLSAFLAETRQRLIDHPMALVGEIGVDKAFRVPEPAADGSSSVEGLTPGGREGRRLSPFRVQPAHQAAILSSQLRLAAELQRPVSVHGVQAHGLLFSTLASTWRGHERTVLSKREKHQIKGIAGIEGIENDDSSDEEEFEDDNNDDEGEDGKKTALGKFVVTPKPFPPVICLHSFSGPVDMLRQYLDPHIPAAIYFSFSTAVNCSTESGCQRTAEVIAACPDDRILLESDLHTAGPVMDKLLEDIYRRVCAIKKWTLAEGVERIAQNYDAFILQTSSKLKKARK
ncbi:Cut9-interacting protein scn1 [Sporothrix stenoceras]|uniref:Cut9-interacting protein scn1 n=1 Tax=Sporothrix stenoceras TaxID=5173 RepID=A0ABR3YXT9_9PEZI